MNELALFAGAGGGLLGSRLLGWKTVCAVEIDPYCREVLLRRQEEEHLEPFPIWDDVRTFNGDAWRDTVDVITAGFPCQPFSVAGKREGESDDRNMWPDTIRIIREVRPWFCWLENVPGLLATGYVWTILKELTEAGYHCAWDVVSAAETGAPHKRDRWWCLAYATGTNARGGTGQFKSEKSTNGQSAQLLSNSGSRGRKTKAGSYNEEDLADTKCNRRKQSAKDIRGGQPIPALRSKNVADAEEQSQRSGLYQKKQAGNGGRRPNNQGWWTTEPDVGRVAHGVAYRVDRTSALGEGQVPAVVRRAWKLLTSERS